MLTELEEGGKLLYRKRKEYIRPKWMKDQDKNHPRFKSLEWHFKVCIVFHRINILNKKLNYFLNFQNNLGSKKQFM